MEIRREEKNPCCSQPLVRQFHGLEPKSLFFSWKRFPVLRKPGLDFQSNSKQFLLHAAPCFLPSGFVWFNPLPSSPSYLSKEMGLLRNSMGGRQELLAPHPGAAGGIRRCFPTF